MTSTVSKILTYIVSSRVGTPPPSLREPLPFLGTPLFMKQIIKVNPLFLRSIQIGERKLYEGVTFGTIPSQLRISLSLLFIFSDSTLYLLLTLALVRYYL